MVEVEEVVHLLTVVDLKDSMQKEAVQHLLFEDGVPLVVEESALIGMSMSNEVIVTTVSFLLNYVTLLNQRFI